MKIELPTSKLRQNKGREFYQNAGAGVRVAVFQLLVFSSEVNTNERSERSGCNGRGRSADAFRL